MKKWKAVRVKQELVEQVKEEIERSEYKGLSEFVSDAIKERLQTLAKQRVFEYLERDKIAGIQQLHKQIFYTPEHIWVRMTPEGIAEVGISEYLQRKLKEVVNIRTDDIGKEVFKGESFGVTESWWFTHDLFSPVSGEIVAVNETVTKDPFILNTDPSIWIVKIQTDPAEIDSWKKTLLDFQKYQEIVGTPLASTRNELQ
ncbi:MAG: hypothetical protein JSV05_06325 [Candidatus Bathyarchaeota archaeon]|nr:MAG: hypothetical protein JSV05_06325 [Candidatus Bathyarchaeota archaeon]